MLRDYFKQVVCNFSLSKRPYRKSVGCGIACLTAYYTQAALNMDYNSALEVGMIVTSSYATIATDLLFKVPKTTFASHLLALTVLSNSSLTENSRYFGSYQSNHEINYNNSLIHRLR